MGPALRPDGDRPGRGKVFPALSEDDSRSLLRELCDAGDVIIWDNITTMHMREAVPDPIEPGSERFMDF